MLSIEKRIFIMIVLVSFVPAACHSDHATSGTDPGDSATGRENETGSQTDASTADDTNGDTDSSSDGDADADTDADAGSDSDTDRDTEIDTEENPYADPLLWEGCPTAGDFPDAEAGAFEVSVTDQAVYCATFVENRTLAEQLHRKALLRVAPGSYALPIGDRDGVGLPFCLRDGENGPPVGAGIGESTYSNYDNGDNMILHHYFLDQPMADPPGGLLQMTYYPQRPEGQAFDLALNGQMDNDLYIVQIDPTRSDPNLECPEAVCAWRRDFDSCTHKTSRLNRHTVQLDTGEMQLDLRIGELLSGTERAAFVHATGTFMEELVDQDDYFKLVYSPAHHHFVRDFAVLFDAPIDGVCGVAIMGLEPKDPVEIRDSQPDQAFTVDCELNPLQELTVLEYRLFVEE